LVQDQPNAISILTQVTVSDQLSSADSIDPLMHYLQTSGPTSCTVVWRTGKVLACRACRACVSEHVTKKTHCRTNAFSWSHFLSTVDHVHVL